MQRGQGIAQGIFVVSLGVWITVTVIACHWIPVISLIARAYCSEGMLLSCDCSRLIHIVTMFSLEMP